MTREQILERLLVKVGDGIWVLATLMKAGKPINKERLKELTNHHFSLKKHDDAPPIRSRHTLDQIAARLEGAGLVDVQAIGRTRMYQLSELGHEVIKFRDQYLQRGVN
ncbi:hypothetical protein PAESOLCIP111_03735 [Paenibacillus solanacearum]|uniref:Uncharacterized protein n=1 Tax=Paenibacillus solanacearum TaxID=2048548 RepID=A0A916K6U9_9BACL|nr:hypothetical protein [Paenibacillus solanacearum]CAG7636058.1 hypothetical protein PAESOLCIP111_03735 [Paenibacillus solanacearum]